MKTSDRERFGYKGAVQRVLLYHNSSPDPYDQLTFNRDGARARERQVQMVTHPDGSQTEIQRVAGVDGLEIHGLQGAILPTNGAATAETTFSVDRIPVQTVFRNQAGEVTSNVFYRADSSGCVVEVSSRSGVRRAMYDPAETIAAEAIWNRYSDVCPFKATFKYDENRHLTEVTTYLFGELDYYATHTVNADGDIAKTTEENNEIWFEYEYDDRRNWVRKIVHHKHGTTQSRRQISYYD